MPARGRDEDTKGAPTTDLEAVREHSLAMFIRALPLHVQLSIEESGGMLAACCPLESLGPFLWTEARLFRGALVFLDLFLGLEAWSLGSFLVGLLLQQWCIVDSTKDSMNVFCSSGDRPDPTRSVGTWLPELHEFSRTSFAEELDSASNYSLLLACLESQALVGH